MKVKISGKKISTAILMGAAVLIFVILVGSCTGKSSEPLSVNVRTVERKNLEKVVEFSGILAPEQTVRVFSELSGQAREVYAAVGDGVAKGQLLAKIDDRQLQAQLTAQQAAVQSVKERSAQAETAIRSAQSNLDLAQISYDRVMKLFEQSVVSQNEVDAAKNKLQNARNALENANQQHDMLSGSTLSQAEAQLEMIELRIDKSEIRSPIDGVVTNCTVSSGENVNMGAPLMTVVDTSTLILQGMVPQEVVPLLKSGQSLLVKVDGFYADDYSGKISRVGPVAATTGQYFPVVVRLGNDGRLMAGMTAMASLKVRVPDSLVVPLSAVHSEGGKNYVYIVSDGKASPCRVELGMRNESSVTVIKGLREGQNVAADNLSLLDEGLALKVAGIAEAAGGNGTEEK